MHKDKMRMKGKLALLKKKNQKRGMALLGYPRKC